MCGYDAEIHLNPGTQDDGGARGTVCEHFGNVLVGDEAIADDVRLACCGHYVEIADRLSAAPIASGNCDFTLADAGLQMRDEGLRFLLGDRQLETLPRYDRFLQRRKNLLLCLLAKALQLVDAA